MFKDIKAKSVYKFFDGKDDSKSFESEMIGLRKVGGVFCELLNYFTIKSDNGIFSKATLDVCEKEFFSLGLGTYLEFSDWDDENVVMAGDAQYPAALIFLAKLKKGVIIFIENTSDGFDVCFDYYVEDGRAKVGSHVIHSQKILRPADRVEINQLIYTFDADCIEDIRNFYNAKAKEVINVNPDYYDFRICASDSLIMTMGGEFQ